MEEVSTISQDILNLRILSTRADNYVSNQEYVSKYGPDDFTEENILKDLYQMVLEELEDLGIYFWDKQYDPLEDWYQARSIYYFRKVFDEDVLLQLFSQNDSVVTGIESIIYSDESDESDVHLILELLNGTFIDHPDISMCVEFQDRVASTKRLTDHLKAVIYTHKHLATLTITDPEKIMPYIKQIELGRKLAKEGVDRILSNLDETGKILHSNIESCGRSTIDMGIVNQLLSAYDLDKIQPTEIEYYASLDLPDDQLDKSLKSLKQKYMDIHHKRSPHHIEYWLEHGTKMLTHAHMILLVAHLYTTYIRSDEFIEEYCKVVKMARTIFTDEQFKIMDTYAYVLLGTLRELGMEDKYGNIPDHSIVS